MSNTTTKPRPAALAGSSLMIAITMSLAACGGGGDDAPASNNNGPLDALAGHWVAPCSSSVDSATKVGTGAFLSLSLEFTWQAAPGGKLAGTQTVRIHEAVDCSSEPLATWTSAIELLPQGNKTASGKAAQKVVLSMAALVPGSSGPSFVLGQVNYVNSTGIWTSPLVHQDLVYREGNRLHWGDVDAAVDADGYPTALDLTPEEAFSKAD